MLSITIHIAELCLPIRKPRSSTQNTLQYKGPHKGLRPFCYRFTKFVVGNGNLPWENQGPGI